MRFLCSTELRILILMHSFRMESHWARKFCYHCPSLSSFLDHLKAKHIVLKGGHWNLKQVMSPPRPLLTPPAWPPAITAKSRHPVRFPLPCPLAITLSSPLPGYPQEYHPQILCLSSKDQCKWHSNHGKFFCSDSTSPLLSCFSGPKPR